MIPIDSANDFVYDFYIFYKGNTKVTWINSGFSLEVHYEINSIEDNFQKEDM